MNRDVGTRFFNNLADKSTIVAKGLRFAGHFATIFLYIKNENT